MADPYAAALAALFRAPGSAAAVYTAPGGMPIPLRVIRSQPDREMAFGQSRVVQASNSFDIQRADVDDPVSGARLVLETRQVFRLHGDALLDVEGLTWTCGAEPSA